MLASSDGAGRRLLLPVIGVVALLAGVVAFSGGTSTSEIDALTDALGLGPGDAVADIGAGTGWLSVEVSSVVGPRGTVYATELDAGQRDAIRATAREAGADITVVEADMEDTNLPPECCDAAFNRRVYHHLSHARDVNASLFEAIKPGGRVAIIEMELSGMLSPLARVWSHWTDDERVVREMTAAGFRHVATEPWPSLGHYVAIFEKPQVTGSSAPVP